LPKKAKKRSNKSEPQGTIGGIRGEAKPKVDLKQAFVAMQIKAMQRAAEPIILEYQIDDVAGVKALNHELVQLAFDRKVDGRTLGAINGILANQIHILIPHPGVTQNVQVIQSQTTLNSVQNWKKLFEQTPEEERLVVARFIKRLAECEVSPSTS
jgi:hypothetical protein